jgi:hypothetical protein
MGLMGVKSLVLVGAMVLLQACGGGGGSSRAPANPSAPPPPAPPPAATEISGRVMLGPLAAAEVTVRAPNFEFSFDTTTDASGNFGPIEVDGAYTGPIEIFVQGTVNSSYICDGRSGCLAEDDTVVLFGEPAAFTGIMRMAIARPEDVTGPISITPFSTAATVRAERLGGLTTANIDTANAEVHALIAELLTSFDASLQLPRQFFLLPLSDLTAPVADATSEQDRAGVLVSLLGSALFKTGGISSSEPDINAPDFIAALSDAFATQGNLPLVSTVREQISRERLNQGLISTLGEWQRQENSADDGALILAATIGESFDTLLERVREEVQSVPSIGSAVGANLLFQPTNDQIGLEPLESVELVLPPGLTADRIAIAFDEPQIRIALRVHQDRLFADFSLTDDAVIQGENIFTPVLFYDTEGEFQSLFAEVTFSFDLLGSLRVDIEQPTDVFERDRVRLVAVSNRPNLETTFLWEQIDGLALNIGNANLSEVTFDVPDLIADDSATLRLTTRDITGAVATNEVQLTLSAYIETDSLQVIDAGLQTCIDDFVTSNNPRDAGDFTRIDCSTTIVDNIAGVSAFRNLAVLDLSGGGLQVDFTEVEGLPNLQILSLGNQQLLRCAEVEAYQSANTEVTISGYDTCNRDFVVKLFGEAHDAVLGPNRNQLFVSIPENREIVIVDVASLRLVDRIATPGEPNGVALSIDGTRLFVALRGSNAIGIVSLADFSITTIDLGTEIGDRRTFDVEEVSPDRLLVTASPSSNGLAWVVEVRLDLANAVSRVADSTIIRATPRIAVDRENDFTYIGAGFSPNSLYKLDTSQADAPIILEDDHGQIGGTDSLTLNSTGSRIHLSSGQILRTGSFNEELRISQQGAGTIGTNPDNLYVLAGQYFGPRNRIAVYGWDNPDPLAEVESSCPRSGNARGKVFILDDNDSDFIWFAGDILCGIASRIEADLDPTPLLALPDPQLDACVRNASAQDGFTEPTAALALDCSAYPGVTDLTGLAEFSQLTELTIEGSFYDLHELQTMGSITDLRLMNNPTLADLYELTLLHNLLTLDVSGSTNVSCAELEDLRNNTTVIDTGCITEARLELGGIGVDVAIDPDADRTYVSVPSLREIVVIETSTFTEQRRISLANVPEGVSLSIGRTELLVALSDIGAIGIINLADDSMVTADVASMLGTLITHDVAEVASDIVLVTGSPNSSGFAYVVRLDRNTGVQTRVASNNIIRAEPKIEVDRNNGFAYISEGFSPNSLYKLDIEDVTAPIVVEDDHGQIIGSVISISLTPDGDFLFTGGGQKVSTDNLLPAGLTTTGASTAVSNNTLALALASTTSEPRATLQYNSIANLQEIGRRHSSCPIERFTSTRPVLTSGAGYVIVVSEDLACRLPQDPPME